MEKYIQIIDGKASPIVIENMTALQQLRDCGLTIIKKADHKEQPEESEFIYLHVDISGGDGMSPVGLANDGVEFVSVAATFKAGPNPTDLTLPISTVFRINIRNDQDTIADVVKIEFKNGLCNFNYTTEGKAGIYHIDESDFYLEISEKKIKLLGETTFKVYRNFA